MREDGAAGTDGGDLMHWVSARIGSLWEPVVEMEIGRGRSRCAGVCAVLAAQVARSFCVTMAGEFYTAAPAGGRYGARRMQSWPSLELLQPIGRRLSSADGLDAIEVVGAGGLWNDSEPTRL